MLAQAHSPSIRMIAAALLNTVARPRAQQPTRQNAPDDVRAKRDCINDIITEHPDAFTGDLDIQNMIFMFPGRF